MPRATWHNLGADRRDRVLHAAMDEFGRNGYSGGSLNVIAREAGVSKGSLFQYFDDKFDFFAHVAEQTSLRVYEAMSHYLSGPHEDETFLDYFVRVAGAWMAYMQAHPLERGVTAATTMELDPQVRAAVREPVHRLYAQALRPLLRAAADRGEARDDVDALLSILVLLLPHLALAPFEPGLDAGVVLYGASARARSARVRRLLELVLAP